MNNKEDDFIGRKFTTTTGSVLTVICDNGLKGNKKKYICTCSTCSSDKVLYQKPFMSAKSNLERGSVPCGCAKTPKWEEYQQVVRVKRECDSRGYIFNGFYGKFNGSNTKLDLENTSNGSRWNTTKISSFFSGSGDPVEGRSKVIESVTKNDEVHIEDFYRTGKHGCRTFSRNKENRKLWDVECSICSLDEYSLSGSGRSVFTCYGSALKRGHTPCYYICLEFRGEVI